MSPPREKPLRAETAEISILGQPAQDFGRCNDDGRVKVSERIFPRGRTLPEIKECKLQPAGLISGSVECAALWQDHGDAMPPPPNVR